MHSALLARDRIGYILARLVAYMSSSDKSVRHISEARRCVRSVVDRFVTETVTNQCRQLLSVAF